ncbi:MAG: GNAT family N-acetyltransferase [Alphaproteobacteria bacterium]
MDFELSHRQALPSDLAVLRSLMDRSIRAFIGSVVDTPLLAAHFDIMGVDTQLIEDGTYFVITLASDAGGHEKIAGCGGWGRRATLFGGDHTAGRSARLLDPSTEPARVRAMYTDPDFARRGIGRRILDLCEGAAAAEGFTRLELFATMAGEPLYAAYGFTVVERLRVPTSTGVPVAGATMAKTIERADRTERDQ